MTVKLITLDGGLLCIIFALNSIKTKLDLELPLTRPIIFPFKPYPKSDFARYENSWQLHLRELETEIIKL